MSHVASFYCACISLWAGQASGLAERGQAGQMSGERPHTSDYVLVNIQHSQGDLDLTLGKMQQKLSFGLWQTFLIFRLECVRNAFGSSDWPDRWNAARPDAQPRPGNLLMLHS